MKKAFTNIVLVVGLLCSAHSFAECPFTTLSDIPGHWEGMNQVGLAVGDVVFRIQNINPNEFSGIASVIEGNCKYGDCDLLDFIVGRDFPFSGTCDEDEELISAIFNNEPVDWVLGKSFGGNLPYGINFEATMHY
jgi:hypothetical protein